MQIIAAGFCFLPLRWSRGRGQEGYNEDEEGTWGRKEAREAGGGEKRGGEGGRKGGKGGGEEGRDFILKGGVSPCVP